MPGMHAVGGAPGLYLSVSNTGARRWVYRVMQAGKRSDIGLGVYPEVSLVEARAAVMALRLQQRNGVDVAGERRERKRRLRAARAAGAVDGSKTIPTFEAYATDWIALHKKKWKNAKHAEQWINTLTTYAFPKIGRLPVDLIETAHVLDVLKPIWLEKTETARRVMQRMKQILDAAGVEGLRAGENPAKWSEHLSQILPAPTDVSPVQHHAAMAIDEVPKLMANLHARRGYSNWALQFVILTVARTQEVLKMRRNGELDEAAAVWDVPSERMKMKRPHRVPIVPRVMALYKSVPPTVGSDLVFPGKKKEKPMSDNTLLSALKKAGYSGLTVHGFRSTFRDWAAERTNYPGDVAEMALSHTVSDKTEAAYRRGDMLERRRAMMADWADFCLQLVPSPAKP